MKNSILMSLVLLITTSHIFSMQTTPTPDSPRTQTRQQLQELNNILRSLLNETDGLKFLQAERDLKKFKPVLDKAIADYTTYADLLAEWDPLYVKCKDRAKQTITQVDRLLDGIKEIEGMKKTEEKKS